MSMKLELDAEEVKTIVLEWAEKQFGPGTFNTIDIETSYSAFKSITLTKEPVDDQTKS